MKRFNRVSINITTSLRVMSNYIAQSILNNRGKNNPLAYSVYRLIWRIHNTDKNVVKVIVKDNLLSMKTNCYDHNFYLKRKFHPEYFLNNHLIT